MIQNEILMMNNLPKKLRNKVKNRKSGLFINTFIIDGENAFGYGNDGKCHLLDTDSVMSAARFVWKIDNDGYVVTYDRITPYGNPLHMEELVLNIYNI